MPASLPYRVTAPAAVPVTLAEAKAHLRVEHEEEDALIAGLVDAATQLLDGLTGTLGRALISQTWALDVTGWRSGGLRLRPGPVRSLESLTIVAPDGSRETVDTAGYRLTAHCVVPPLDGAPSLPSSEHWLELRFVTGYGDAQEDVPAPVRQAILLLIGAWYENREAAAVGAAAAPLPASIAIEALLAPYRAWSV